MPIQSDESRTIVLTKRMHLVLLEALAEWTCDHGNETRDEDRVPWPEDVAKLRNIVKAAPYGVMPGEVASR